MNGKVKPEGFRKLSVIALVLGILTYSYIYLIPQIIFSLVFTLRDYIQDEAVIASIVGSVVLILMGMPIAAVVCGSIDLKKIAAGIYSKKGRGFDITGIILGGIFIIFALFFLIGEIAFPH